jgi:hypothetical protein
VTKQNPPKKSPKTIPPPDPKREKEAREVAQEYIDNQKSIIEGLRKRLH